MPRLLFGEYLERQFTLTLNDARRKGFVIDVYLNCLVTDVDFTKSEKVVVSLADGVEIVADRVVICTGHYWPKIYETTMAGWFDSPYPPSKLCFRANHTVAVRGASLTAVDAIRTLAHSNGSFHEDEHGRLVFQRNDNSTDFKILLHSRHGLLPAVRIYLEDPQLAEVSALSAAEIGANRAANDGFLSLDFVFDRCFKQLLREKDAPLFLKIKDWTMEQFVDDVLPKREQFDAFALLAAEYNEAEHKMKRSEPIYWKELLAALSFVMNYSAKYFSAEDMLRLKVVFLLVLLLFFCTYYRFKI